LPIARTRSPSQCREHFGATTNAQTPIDTESQEDPYLNLIARFAVEFEQTYLHWLYEALVVVEARQKQAPEGEE
jgi:hypothetical protein